MDYIEKLPESILLVTPENWGFCRYRLGDMVAFISFGAESDAQGNIQEYFLLTVQDEDFRELYQKKFPTLEEACQILNISYDHWDFEDQTSPSTDGGCGSCQAH